MPNAPDSFVDGGVTSGFDWAYQVNYSLLAAIEEHPLGVEAGLQIARGQLGTGYEINEHGLQESGVVEATIAAVEFHQYQGLLGNDAAAQAAGVTYDYDGQMWGGQAESPASDLGYYGESLSGGDVGDDGSGYIA